MIILISVYTYFISNALMIHLFLIAKRWFDVYYKQIVRLINKCTYLLGTAVSFNKRYCEKLAASLESFTKQSVVKCK